MCGVHPYRLGVGGSGSGERRELGPSGFHASHSTLRRRQLRAQQRCRFLFHRLQQLFGVTVIGRYGNGGQSGALPQILIIDFGHGDVEFAAQPVLQAAHYLPFVFQRERILEPQLERENTDGGHFKRTPRSLRAR